MLLQRPDDPGGLYLVGGMNVHGVGRPQPPTSECKRVELEIDRIHSLRYSVRILFCRQRLLQFGVGACARRCSLHRCDGLAGPLFYAAAFGISFLNASAGMIFCWALAAFLGFRLVFHRGEGPRTKPAAVTAAGFP